MKTRSSKSQKIEIFQRGIPWFRSKNGRFSNFLGGGNSCQENVFYDSLERKNTFVGYKNKKFAKSKNWRFSRGVNPWYWSKTGHFSDFPS